MANLQDIKSVDWQPKLNEIGSIVEDIDDIDQCIKIILMTRKGSDPHRPEFGSDIWQYIDAPVNVAISNIIREVMDAINIWETRVEIKGITAQIEESNINLQINRQIKNTDIQGILEVAV
ncbi:MAG: GPW/gp25 family protein [Candidatus Peregrinibacteria bacterium GW2011_GWC2_33_13]|nr:MAG: GPW/gp25 family protein [Candidatus Peregrinibacteria bacterium GW2011_GWC2_33_13]